MTDSRQLKITSYSLNCMQKYKITRKIGEGAFSNVFLGKNTQTGEKVAIKAHKPGLIEIDKANDLREVVILKKIRHPSIIHLEDTFIMRGQFFMVFEYMEANLYQKYLSSNVSRSIDEKIIKNIIFRVSKALEEIHQIGYFHRDLKPQNILVTGDEIKLADFGLARKYIDPSFLTDYVSTRWYRAPQLVIRMAKYSAPVDIFALGCIMAELYNRRPLFPGNNEKDQLSLILTRIALPNHEQWPQFFQWCKKRGIVLTDIRSKTRQKPLIDRPQNKKHNLAEDLLQSMLAFNPSERITAKKILQHPYFSQYHKKQRNTSHNKQRLMNSKSPFIRKLKPQKKMLQSLKTKNVRVMARNDETINTEYFDNFIKIKQPLGFHEQSIGHHNTFNSEDIGQYETKPKTRKVLKIQSSKDIFGRDKNSREKSHSGRKKQKKRDEFTNRDSRFKSRELRMKQPQNASRSQIDTKKSILLRKSRSRSEKRRNFSGFGRDFINSKTNLPEKTSLKQQLLAITHKKNQEYKSQGNTKVCTPTNNLNQQQFISSKTIKTIQKTPANSNSADYKKFMGEYISDRKEKIDGRRKHSKEKIRVRKISENQQNPYY